jgi:hypothetical protein
MSKTRIKFSGERPFILVTVLYLSNKLVTTTDDSRQADRSGEDHDLCVSPAPRASRLLDLQRLAYFCSMATFTEVALSGDSLMSNAPVSGNLFECGPLFVDEYSILLCASGYANALYIQRDELSRRSSS